MANVHLDFDESSIGEIQGRTNLTLREVAELVEKDAKLGCPVLTGDLQGTIGSERVTDELWRVYVGGEDADYWATVEYGSDPHPIDSHGPWPLRNHETGQVFGPHVDHPGTPEQPFMRPALYRIRRLPDMG